MIGHHRPGEKTIFFAVEMPDSALDDTSGVRTGQWPRPFAAIEKSVDSVDARGLVHEKRFRQAVGGPEHHVLNSFGRVEVRQIAARMPSLGSVARFTHRYALRMRA
jgi:hypothetical protein